MSDWVFLGEQTENGLVYQLAMNRCDGQYFRFEPVATGLRVNAASQLRQEIENRSIKESDLNLGIISVIGPIFHEGRYWLGWKDRNGQNLFSGRKIRQTLQEELADLYPLINSYQIWRQLGLTVGRPEWRRLAIDSRGLFMLDPKAAFYLNQPCLELPITIERSRPAEEYRNQSLEYYRDLFYLGLIIYYYLTGEVPFALRKGWPTQDIVAGKVINPQIYRPKLPPGLGRLIMAMLAPEPLERPTIDVVAGLWNEYLKLGPENAKPDLNVVLPKPVSLKKETALTKALSKVALPVTILALLIIGLSIAFPRNSPRPKVSPLKAAAHFYQEMGRVDFNNQKGDSVQISVTDFEDATKRRLEMVGALLSKPVLEVDQIRIVTETPEMAVIEADLTWWEWSAGGWTRRQGREKLVFRKQGRKLKLESRNLL